jgi:U4/U6 small nuclear ribonucleoprotein PRP3
VNRIKKLSDPSHQFKVSKNAQQHGLTGVCIINPNFSLIYVEGGSKGMKHYTRLMQHRIDWTTAARRRDKGDDEEGEEGDGEADEGNNNANATGSNNDEQDGEDPLADNRCDLIWEGAIAEHGFHNFKTVRAPTDNLAREQLGTKLSSWWDSAKNWKPADED